MRISILYLFRAEIPKPGPLLKNDKFFKLVNLFVLKSFSMIPETNRKTSHFRILREAEIKFLSSLKGCLFVRLV